MVASILIEMSKSLSSYVFTLNSGVVSGKSSRHEMTIDSTTEVGYIETFEATKEVV